MFKNMPSSLDDTSSLNITEYNRDVPWLGISHTDHEWHSINDMLDAYSPFGEVRTVLTSLRPGIGFNGYQGSATAMSLDHVLRRVIGLPALPSGLDRDIYGGGKGLTLEDSVLSSLGEAIERMIGAFSSLRNRLMQERSGLQSTILNEQGNVLSDLTIFNFLPPNSSKTQTFCAKNGIGTQSSYGFEEQIY